MKQVVTKFLFVFGLMLLASCGTDLPEGIDNVEIKKDDGKQDPTPQNDNIPSEDDNPLPTY